MNERCIIKNDDVVEWANWYNNFGENQGNCLLNTYEWLVNQDGEINEDYGDGNTALHFACRDGFNEVIKFLLNNGAEIDRKNDCGMTPIFYVGNFIDTPDTLELMIEKGADLHLVDDLGDNILHNAVMMQSTKCVKFLLNYINPFLMNNDRKSAIDLSFENGLEDIFKDAEKEGLFNDFKELPELVRDRI